MLTRQHFKKVVTVSRAHCKERRSKENTFHLYAHSNPAIQKLKYDFVAGDGSISEVDIMGGKRFRKWNIFHKLANLSAKPTNWLIGHIDEKDRKNLSANNFADQDSSTIHIIGKSAVFILGGIIELPFYVLSKSIGKLGDIVFLDPLSTLYNKYKRSKNKPNDVTLEPSAAPTGPRVLKKSKAQKDLKENDMNYVRNVLPYTFSSDPSSKTKVLPAPMDAAPTSILPTTPSSPTAFVTQIELMGRSSPLPSSSCIIANGLNISLEGIIEENKLPERKESSHSSSGRISPSSISSVGISVSDSKMEEAKEHPFAPTGLSKS
jgi:hypothetical protein